MRVSQAFPSKYLKADDLQGRTVNVVIDSVQLENVAPENKPPSHKPVAYFQGKERGLVLNKTNANTIAASYGDEMEDWAGSPITLFPTKADFQGRTVDAIRVSVPARAAAAQSPAAPKRYPPDHITTGPQQPRRDDMDEEIPF